MNIDNLISKYLDGELSEKEDLKLRNIISSNEKAREVFNAYVDLHLNTKEDAESINTPFELFSDTEDKVLMAIMSAKPTVAEVRKSFGILHIFPKQLTTMVAVLLLICFINISDWSFINSIIPSYSISNLEITLPSQDRNQIKNIASSTVKAKDNQSIAEINPPNESAKTVSFVTIQSNENNSIENELISLNNKTNKQLEKVLDNNGYNNSNNSISQKLSDNSSSTPSISILGNNTGNSTTLFDNVANRVRPEQNNLAINNIQLTAFSSTPYSVFGFDEGANASLKSYSQAISLRLNDKTDVGLEIGFSDFTYKGEIFTSTNVLDKYGRETGQQLVFRTEKNKEYALYWGQFFFQTQLYKLDKLDLGLRLGLGMSSDGLISNSKVVASYEIVNGLKLITGSEFSFFNASLPQLVNANSDNYYSLSFIYGLQFSF